MPRAKSSPQSPASAFAAGVAALAAKASSDALAGALGALVKARTAKPARRAPAGYNADTWGTPAAMDPSSGRGGPFKRRAVRVVKRGRNQAYTPTGRWNDARRGTFRHHLIDVASRHQSTYAAQAEHDGSKYADKKLDWSWLAANGYITLI